MSLPYAMMCAQVSRRHLCVQREASPPEANGPRSCQTSRPESGQEDEESHRLRLYIGETQIACASILSSASSAASLYRLALANLAAVRAAMSSYSSMPPSSFLSCPRARRKTLPGAANPDSSSSDSLLSSASSSPAARTPGASLYGDSLCTTVLRGGVNG